MKRHVPKWTDRLVVGPGRHPFEPMGGVGPVSPTEAKAINRALKLTGKAKVKPGDRLLLYRGERT